MNHALSRRTFLTSAGAATLGLAALRCGGDDPSGGDQPEPTLGPVKRGGTFQLGTTVPAISIDPHTEVTMGLAFVCFIYGYLLHEITPDEGAPVIIYDHAESLERPDEETMLFKLRQGIRFQDLPPANGREVTAEDVVYSFDRIAGVGSTPFWRETIVGKSAPDPYTFQIKLSGPYAYTMEEVGGIRSTIVPREAVEEWGDLKTHGLGSGPFMVRDLSRGETMDMQKNPNYYVEGVPYIDNFRWRIIADDASLRAAFKAKQVDSYGPPTKIQADEIAGLGEHVIITKNPSTAVFALNLNEIKTPVLQDIRVREALDISIDRDDIIERLCFGDGNYTGPVSWGLEFWSLPQDELRRLYKRDVPKARQLLAAAGAEDLTLEMIFPSGPTADLAAIIKANTAEAGINIQLQPQEMGTWLANHMSLNYSLNAAGGLPLGSENLPLQFNHTKNWTRDSEPLHLPEPETDALLDKILVTTDVNERQKLVLDATRRIIARHGNILYLYAPYGYSALWDYVRGYENLISAGMIAFTYDMWLDK